MQLPNTWFKWFLLVDGQSNSSLKSKGQSMCPSQRRKPSMQGPFSQRHWFTPHPPSNRRLTVNL